MVVQRLFEDIKELSFFGLAQTIFAYRLYLRATHTPVDGGAGETVHMTKEDFNKIIDERFPKRLQHLINSSKVPTYAEIETASKNFWGLGSDREDSFLKTFNNLIFLQTSKKLKKHRKSVPLQTINQAKNMALPEGRELFSNMMNVGTNGFVDMVAFVRFFRFSSLYLEIDAQATQRMNHDTF